VHGGMIDMWF